MSVRRRLGYVLLALVLIVCIAGQVFARRNGRTPVAGTVGDMRTASSANAAGVPSQVRPTPSESPRPTPSPSASPTGPPAYLSATTPSAGVGEHRTRLLPAVTAPPGTGGYAF